MVTQSAAIGLVGGALGVLTAVVMSLGVDALAASYLPDFPYKPETFFALHPLVIVSGIAFSIVCCVAGAIVPAARASRVDPVTVLTST